MALLESRLESVTSARLGLKSASWCPADCSSFRALFSDWFWFFLAKSLLEKEKGSSSSK